ncbi:MAG: DoxX family protein [Rhodospirillales bacterium]|nr:DoxX family protein [Rhodospirillales bacterium]
MHADHSALQIIAHVCIAFLFLFRGVTAFPQFDEHLKTFKGHGIPFPRLVLSLGLATMLLGGLSVLFDFLAWIGAAMLVLFTVLSNFIYHHFWTMTEPGRRQTHLWIFCNNIGVIGGLLLVVAI